MALSDADVQKQVSTINVIGVFNVSYLKYSRSYLLK